MEHLCTFIFCFIFIFIFYFIIVYSRKKGIQAFKKGKQLEYFKTVYNLKLSDEDLKKFVFCLSLTNAFIIALVITIVEFFDNLFLKLLLGFVLLIPLILICYDILAKAFGGIRQRRRK